jgi:hypothetical protein
VALDGERLAGFSAALARGDSWFLSALFVLPQYQGRRVGRELLDRSWAGEYGARMTITDSIQPVSTGMYARRGLIPTTPIFSVSGSPTADLPPDLEAVVPEPEGLAALDHDKRRPSRCRRSWPAGNHSMRRFTCRAARADCFAIALASGLRITRPPGLLLLSERLDPPQAVAISGYWLF